MSSPLAQQQSGHYVPLQPHPQPAIGHHGAPGSASQGDHPVQRASGGAWWPMWECSDDKWSRTRSLERACCTSLLLPPAAAAARPSPCTAPPALQLLTTVAVLYLHTATAADAAAVRHLRQLLGAQGARNRGGTRQGAGAAAPGRRRARAGRAQHRGVWPHPHHRAL